MKRFICILTTLFLLIPMLSALTAGAESEGEVLFEVDFSGYSSLEELEENGFKLLNNRANYSFADGALIMGSDSDGYCRLILPEWLGDYGNYSVTVEAKMLTTTDTARWFGLVYRIQNENNAYYPYYHMCVRENTTAANGVEFAERTSANAWNVAQTASGDIASAKDGYHTYNITAFDKTVQYNIDGEEVLYVNESTFGSKTELYEKGMIGLTMNNGTLSVKSIKVTAQSEAPARPEKKLDLINNAHSELNLINPIANIQYISDVSALESEVHGSAMFKISELEDPTAVIKKCLEKKILPTFYIDSVEEADILISAMTKNTCNDVNIISKSAEALEKMRSKKARARTGLAVSLESATLDSETANAIRCSVRSAPATFCVIKSENASKQAVSELQELALAVWVEVDAEPDSAEYTAEALRAVTSGANGIITKSASKLTEIINTYLAENAMTRTPVMIGHRGNPTQAPENSLSSFIAAYNNGADVFEVDVEITKDGEIIIMHDNTLNRTTNYTGNKTVNAMTLAEIKECYLLAKDGSVSDEKVPTLKEVFEEFKDKDCRIFIEFKGGNAANVPATAALIKEYGMEDKVDVISFNTAFLKTTQSELNGMSTGYLHSPNGGAATVEDALESLYPSMVTAQTTKSSINPSNGVATVYYMQAATDRGMTVWPWTYGLATNNNGFLSGCDGVTTDDMQWVTNMVKYLETNLESGSSSMTVGNGSSAELTVSAVTYGGESVAVAGDDLIVKVISGEDCITFENNTVNGVKNGMAQLLFGYKTKTTDGSEYVVYTQPVTVDVVTVQVAEEKGNNTEIYTAIGIIAAAIILGAAAIVVIRKK